MYRLSTKILSDISRAVESVRMCRVSEQKGGDVFIPRIPLPAKLTPFEQQVVMARQRVNNNVIMVVMIGYKYKFFGRDSRVTSRRLGIACVVGTPSVETKEKPASKKVKVENGNGETSLSEVERVASRLGLEDGNVDGNTDATLGINVLTSAVSSAFESSSVPAARVMFHVQRLVSMGYHVVMVEQAETAAGRAAEGGGDRTFERKITKAFSRSTAPDFSALVLGSQGSSAAQSQAAGEGGEDEVEAKAAAMLTPTEPSVGVEDNSNCVIFLLMRYNEPTDSTLFYITVLSISSNAIATDVLEVGGDVRVPGKWSDENLRATSEGPAGKRSKTMCSKECPSCFAEALKAALVFYSPVEVVIGVPEEKDGDAATREPLPAGLMRIIEAVTGCHYGPTDEGSEDVRSTVQCTVIREGKSVGYYIGDGTQRATRAAKPAADDRTLEVDSQRVYQLYQDVFKSKTGGLRSFEGEVAVPSDYIPMRTSLLLALIYVRYFSYAHVLRIAESVPFLYRGDQTIVGKLEDAKHIPKMVLSNTALAALEVFESSVAATGLSAGAAARRPGRHSLFSALNKCLTPAGARKLKEWISAPLCDVKEIQHRQEAVLYVRDARENVRILLLLLLLSTVDTMGPLSTAVRSLLKSHSNPNDVRSRLISIARENFGSGGRALPTGTLSSTDIGVTLSRLSAGRCSYAEYRLFLTRIASARLVADSFVAAYREGGSCVPFIDYAVTQLDNQRVAQLIKEESALISEESSAAEETVKELFNDEATASLLKEELVYRYLCSGVELPEGLATQVKLIIGITRFLDVLLKQVRALLRLPALTYKIVAGVTNIIEVPSAHEKFVPVQNSGSEEKLRVPDDEVLRRLGETMTNFGKTGYDGCPVDISQDDWLLVSRVKGFARYRTDAITYLVTKRTAVAEHLAENIKKVFCAHQIEVYGDCATSVACSESGSEYWKRNARAAVMGFVRGVATLDVIQSLAIVAAHPGCCMPLVVENNANNDKDFIRLIGLSHPIVLLENYNLSPLQSMQSNEDEDAVMNEASAADLGLMAMERSMSNSAPQPPASPGDACTASSYIPCNVVIEGGTRMWLLTGPNMAGKSALMRSVALASVMAQIGGPICCRPGVGRKQQCRVPVFTSIRTRMGATNDALIESTSTFMEEMIETREILTARDLSTSFILLDELGRGTSSYDGVAVADATLRYYLAHCRDPKTGGRAFSMFVTHYHELCGWHAKEEGVKLRYMDYRIFDKDGICEESDSAVGKEKVKLSSKLVFLYQPVEGVSPASFGVHVAASAGLPQPLLIEAEGRSVESEKAHTLSTAFKKLRKAALSGI